MAASTVLSVDNGYLEGPLTLQPTRQTSSPGNTDDRKVFVESSSIAYEAGTTRQTWCVMSVCILMCSLLHDGSHDESEKATQMKSVLDRSKHLVIEL